MEELAPTGRAIGSTENARGTPDDRTMSTRRRRARISGGRCFSSWSPRRCCAGYSPLPIRPGSQPSGSCWHDEGAWVHNARNMALFGAWVQDRWNPLYVAPVFTGLEYLSFATFGVGLWQARLVSELCGLLAVALLACGVRRLAGRDAGLIAGALLATNYIGVMWDRAALLEASMVAFVVAAWYCLRSCSDTAALGRARCRVRPARLFHQSGSRLFHRRSRRRSSAAVAY